MTDLEQQTTVSLARLQPRLHARFNATADPVAWQAFTARLETHFGDLFRPLLALYGHHYDFFYHLEEIVASAAHFWLERPEDLQALDLEREQNPLWYQAPNMMGATCYVDLFAGTLRGMENTLPYLQELGLTYLHLMPLFLTPKGNNDGGYAVSSYRDVNPALGTMADLAALARTLRKAGISLVLDFIFNHTSDEHVWAQRALAGEPEYQAYYFMFQDRALPDAYQQHLRDIFPDQRPGSFTYRSEVGRWVWTTFNSFQWDLNYGNPTVFRRMSEEMLFLANQGAEVLRLDAVAFAWKQMGTSCESLPQVHLLVQAFNVLARIAAPALIFKSEAIVHPDEVARYIAPNQCQISYNPLLMALLWETLATREARLLQLSMQERFPIDRQCAWVNYVRSHDDIGWTFADDDARRLGMDPFGHRRFLNDFYTGRFPGSFASGLPFQENPRTGDARVCGTCASLAGLEQALREENAKAIDLAVARILLLYGIVLSIGGIPLLYMGDELGMLNDYSYAGDAEKRGDSRWVHRSAMDWTVAARRHEPATVQGRIFAGLVQMIRVRTATTALAGGEMEVVYTSNGRVFSYARRSDAERVLVLANMSEWDQQIPAREVWQWGYGHRFDDLVSGEVLTVPRELLLAPYQIVWLRAAQAGIR